MARRAAHLGMSSLDTDALAERERAEERLGVTEGGWVTVPASLRKRGGKGGVGGAMSPEQKARIRLEGLARDVLDVLAGVEWEGQGLGARCLAWGYLALMVVPEVPRPWLREVVEGRYAALGEFVRGFRGEVFPEGRELPWVTEGAQDRAVEVGMRFVRGVMAEVPLAGEQWSRWWMGRKNREVLRSKGVKTNAGGGLLVLLGVGLGVAAVGSGVFFYRGLPPFGAAVQVWRKPVVTLSSLGAAGALVAGAF